MSTGKRYEVADSVQKLRRVNRAVLACFHFARLTTRLIIISTLDLYCQKVMNGKRRFAIFSLTTVFLVKALNISVAFKSPAYYVYTVRIKSIRTPLLLAIARLTLN